MLSLRAPGLGALAGALVALAVVLSGPPATAETGFESAYGFERTWNASLRLIRVDLGFKVTEKDESNGYLLFDYKSKEGSAKGSTGSVELIRGREPDLPVKVVVQLPAMPRYHEQVIVDELAKKMKRDYGEPPKKKPTTPPPPPDAGPDSGVDPGASK